MALTAAPLGIGLGLLIAFAKLSGRWTPRLCGVFLSGLMRGLPELLTLLLILVFGQRLLSQLTSVLGAGFIDLSPFFVGVAALSLVFGAYAGEVFLGSFRAIPVSHREAASALSLPPLVALRFVILPELFRLSRPGLTNLWVHLLKQTSLASVIGYHDFLRSGYIAASSTAEHIFFYAVVCCGYLVINLLTAPVFALLMGSLATPPRLR